MEIDDFEIDIYSTKIGDTKKIVLNLAIEGRSVYESEIKILDSLNIIISSFSKETLFTSKGKEEFKKAFKKYLESRYAIDVDEIYIQKLILKEDDCDKLIKILRDKNIK